MAQGGLAERVTHAWYASRTVLWLWLLWPLSLLYSCVVRFRRFLYVKGLMRSQTSSVPVIVVGNLVVGGAGKSPLVSYLVRGFRKRGFNPGVVARGYGAQTSHKTPFRVCADTSPFMSGDEPLMHAQVLGCRVSVCSERALAVRDLVEQGCDIVIADDGLQHYAMARDYEIAVFDAKRLAGNGHLMPMGPLREPMTRLKSVNKSVLNGGKGNELANALGMDLVPTCIRSLDDTIEHAIRDFIESARGQTVHAYAGIGRPERFFETLRGMGFELQTFPMADHHDFTLSDFANSAGHKIIMTEKDAVKCRQLNLQNAWYVPVEAQLSGDLIQDICDDLNLDERNPSNEKGA